MNASAWYEELTGESPLETVQKAQAPEPVTESDKARAWLAGLNLDGMKENDTAQADFFKYTVSVYCGKFGYSLYTRSPQQKQWRRSLPTAWARGKREDLQKGLERFISDREAKQARHNAQRDAKRQARAEFMNPYKAGDFLYSSWGYDQTNREFYQVLEVRPTALLIREVMQNITERTGYDSWLCEPIPGKFRKEAQWVTLQVYANGDHSVPSPIHGGLYKYEGKPLYASDGH